MWRLSHCHSNTFQSTLPARGATKERKKLAKNLEISIHAPRTGSDAFPPFRAFPLNHFNPRSPHGERLFQNHMSAESKIFQSTLPARGATRCMISQKILGTSFQSTLPARGATREYAASVTETEISIHAPRTGSDGEITVYRHKSNHFNPRSPHGERRLTFMVSKAMNTFQSTLPARGATILTIKTTRQRAFQSTLPARGATV